MPVTVFCDVRGALRAWVNAQTAWVGAGKPLTNGLHLTARDSPGAGTIAVVTRAGGGADDALGLEAPTQQFSVWGPDWGKAESAALALANGLRGLRNVVVTTDRGEQVRLTHTANVTLLQSPDGTRPRFVVSADVWAAPA